MWSCLRHASTILSPLARSHRLQRLATVPVFKQSNSRVSSIQQNRCFSNLPGSGNAYFPFKKLMGILALPALATLIAVKSHNAFPFIEDFSKSDPLSITITTPVSCDADEAKRKRHQTESDDDSSSSVEELLRFKQSADQMEQENEALRARFLELQQNKAESGDKPLPRISVVMYASLVDKLNSPDLDIETKDILPRVVVIGDQSAGKTSVLEMYAEARIFPRGGGEMMTRSPIQVTLTEGSEKVAYFTNEEKLYKLTNENDLQALRNEIEVRMRASISPGNTVSEVPISLVVKGSKHRVVLVDLPGVIGSTTLGMSTDTKRNIENLCRKYADNPNSIILCIQDGSVDAERSNVTELVKEVDPEGKRTIFVMTKIDQAEKNIPPERIRSTLSGQLVNVYALGYFAVVCGTNNPNASISEIKSAERKFLQTSKLFSNNIVKASQYGMDELTRAIDTAFWEQVRQSIYDQLEIINHELIRREKEFERQFGTRILSRQEIFNITKYRILDSIHQIGQMPLAHLEKYISISLWKILSKNFMESVYTRNALEKGRPEQFHTAMEIFLSNWSQTGIAAATLEMEKNVIFSVLEHIINIEEIFEEENSPASVLFKEVMKRSRAQLKVPQENHAKMVVLQTNILRDERSDMRSWFQGCLFMSRVLEDYRKSFDTVTMEVFGEKQAWYNIWPTITPEQKRNQALREILIEYAEFKDSKPPLLLKGDDLNDVKRSIAKKTGLNVDDQKIQELYRLILVDSFINASINSSSFCLHNYGKFDAQKRSPNTLQCRDVIIFSRVQELIASTSRAARMDIFAMRTDLESIVRQTLDSIAANDKDLRLFVQGRRVELAESIIAMRSLQEQLRDFIGVLEENSP